MISSALTFIIGVLVSLAASSVDAIGINLQRRDHVHNASLPEDEQKHECKRLTWHIGFFLYISSQLFGSVAALYFLQPAVVAALGAAALIFNFIFANLLVGTKIQRKEIIGTFFIIMGAVLVAIFGDLPKQELNTSVLNELWSALGFILYFSILIFIIIVIFSLTLFFHHLINKPEKRSKMPLISKMELDDFKKLTGMGYATSGGLIASTTVLLAESGIRLAVLSFTENQFYEPLPYVVIFCLGTTALLQVFCMNSGLKLCDSVVIVPIYFAYYSLFALFNTNMYYNLWSIFPPVNYSAIIPGLISLVFGVYLISASETAHMHSTGEQADEEAQMEEASPISSDDNSNSPLMKEAPKLETVEIRDVTDVIQNVPMNQPKKL